MQLFRQFLYGLTGFLIAAGLAVGWYFSVPHYTKPLSGEARIYLQEQYPGGTFQNIWEYKRCQEVFWTGGPRDGQSQGNHWVIYKQGGDMEMTDKSCWQVPKSPNQDDTP